jgi:hypothetical protein
MIETMIWLEENLGEWPDIRDLSRIIRWPEHAPTPQGPQGGRAIRPYDGTPEAIMERAGRLGPADEEPEGDGAEPEYEISDSGLERIEHAQSSTSTSMTQDAADEPEPEDPYADSEYSDSSEYGSDAEASASED